MFPGLHPAAMMSTGGMGNMAALGGGGNNLHHSVGAQNCIGVNGPMNNQHQQIGGNGRPVHMPHGGNTHAGGIGGHQVGSNPGFGGSSQGFPNFNGGGGPHHPNQPGGGPAQQGFAGHQINQAIGKQSGMGGHGHAGFHLNNHPIGSPQASALAAVMGGLNLGPGVTNGGGDFGGGPQLPSGQQQEISYLHIPNTSVGAVIGTKGSHIRNIIKFSGAHVKIAQNSEAEKSPSEINTPTGDGLPSPTDRRVTIIGTPESQWKV